MGGNNVIAGIMGMVKLDVVLKESSAKAAVSEVSMK